MELPDFFKVKIHPVSLRLDLEPVYGDVAQIIRCKNCKFWNPYVQKRNETGHCTCMYMETPKDGFCYEARRKNEVIDDV